MKMQSSLPWWRTNSYSRDEALPESIQREAGPEGVALVKAWPSGNTDKGWGLQGPAGEDGFMPRYARGEFNARRVLHGYNADRWAFAIVMRSVRLVCIDIDGKNGGLEHALRLGMLPVTLAETSKSGTGYHLFYTVDEEWDELKGFGLLSDRIGLETGVDIRATGCVYHHKQQRWNDADPVPLPDHLKDQLLHRERKLQSANERIVKVLNSQDDLEILMMQDEFTSELAKPIPDGKRNNTLFAIGNKMKLAGVAGWDKLVSERADEVGLEQNEIDLLIRNIGKYGVATP